MAGLFGLFDFTKEGKGVYKDERKSPWYVRFVKYYGRNFFRLIIQNLIYVGFSLPSIVINSFFMVISSQYIFYKSFDELMAENSTYGALVKIIYVLILLLPLLSFGPAYSGMAFTTRNMSRDVPYFTWSDYWRAFRTNWKKTTLLMLMNYAITFIFSVCIGFYFNNEGFMYTVCGVLVLIVFLIYIVMVMYQYLLIVSFNFKWKTIIKNSFALAMLRIPQNILVLIAIGIIFVAVLYVPIQIAALFYLFLLPGTITYIISFGCWSGIKKYVVVESEDDKKDDPIFKD